MRTPRTLVAIMAALGPCLAAQSQYSSTFESPPYIGSGAGTLLPGQDGWYAVAGSADFNVHTYAGNLYGIAANPAGGDQFIAGRFPGQTAFARAQHAHNFSAGGVWTIQWDCLGLYNGTLPTVDNLGSFSLQPSASARYWQQIMQWGTNNLPAATHYDINYGIWDIAPYNQTLPSFVSPGAAWKNIPVNHWIRQWTTWDFTSNRILTIAIQNLTLGTPIVVVDVSNQPYYMRFGPNGAGPLPTDLRFFTGGGSGTSPGGNITAWDNLILTNNPCAVLLNPCRADVTADGTVNVSDLLTVINTWAQNNPSGPRPQGDCDPPPSGNCLVNVSDLLAVINAWGTCPAQTGSCCMTGGVCSVLSYTDCTNAGGLYNGFGTTCSPNPCPQPCAWTCAPGGVAEGEVCLTADPDNTNGGCNSTPTVYGAITPNVPICGTASTYMSGTNQVRDTDWYRFTVTTAGTYRVRVNAQFTALIGIQANIAPPGSACSSNAFVAGSSLTTTAAQNCTTVTAGTVTLNPGDYAVFVAPSVFTGFPCTGPTGGSNSYWVELVSP